MRRLAALSMALMLGGVCAATAESIVRPMPRPALAGVVIEAVTEPTRIAATQMLEGTGRLIRPKPRPQEHETSAASPKKGLMGKLFGPKQRPKSAAMQPASGSVCKDRGIRGTAIPTIRGPVKGCGIENPVRVTEVDGVTLNTPATLDCEAAVALREWVSDALKPSFGQTEVTGLRVAAHYACRTRNNRPGARVSEHGRGKAIDISGIKLANGTELTVLEHYKSGKGKAIRAAHKKACGIFGTTLGPGSDGYHRDHLHLDTARYRGGNYCK